MYMTEIRPPGSRGFVTQKGHVFRWFALNIPMDLGTAGSFTSDMDIIACLRSGYEAVAQALRIFRANEWV
jgi:hypothetical protein